MNDVWGTEAFVDTKQQRVLAKSKIHIAKILFSDGDH